MALCPICFYVLSLQNISQICSVYLHICLYKGTRLKEIWCCIISVLQRIRINRTSVYNKELVHVIMEAEKSQDLQSTSWSPRRQNTHSFFLTKWKRFLLFCTHLLRLIYNNCVPVQAPLLASNKLYAGWTGNSLWAVFLRLLTLMQEASNFSEIFWSMNTSTNQPRGQVWACFIWPWFVLFYLGKLSRGAQGTIKSLPFKGAHC